MMPERLLLASGGHYPSGVVYTLISNGTDKIIHDRQVKEIQPLSICLIYLFLIREEAEQALRNAINFGSSSFLQIKQSE
jgi:hypothetical protein